MWITIQSFLKTFFKLTPANKINMILLSLIFYMGWDRHCTTIKYDQLYISYTKQLDINQTRQNGLNIDCADKFAKYQLAKDAEIRQLSIDYDKKYEFLLQKYEEIIINKKNK